MQWTRGTALDKWAKLGLAARAFKALSNASVFLFLLLPLVVLSNCGGTLATFTGYGVLQETAVPTSNTDPIITIPFGPDWWVVGVMVFAAAGLGTAWRGGIPRSLIGGAAAIGGLIALDAAISFFNPPTDTQSWSPNASNGGFAIGLAFASVIVFELASLAARGWSEAKRATDHKGDWTALGCFATGFAILLGLGVLAVALLTLATGARTD
jgi:hypothetical protein